MYYGMVSKLKSRKLRNAVILIVGRGLQIIGQVIIIRVLTTLMTPQQVGSINQMNSVSSLPFTVLTAPVSLYLARGFLEWVESDSILQYISKFLKYTCIVSVFSMGAVFLIQMIFPLVNGFDPIWVIVLIGIFIIGQTVSTLATSILNLLGYITKYVVFSNVSIWLGLGFAVCFFHYSAKPELWVLGQYLGIGISTYAIFILFRVIKDSFSKHIENPVNKNDLPFNRSAILSFAWPQAITLVFWWIQSQGYRFILDKIDGLNSVGLFSVAYGLCAMPLATFEALFNQYYSPTFFHALKRENIQGQAVAWNAYASAYIPASILVGIYIISSGPFLTALFLGKNFQNVSSILIWPAMTETLRVINSSQHFLGIAKIDMKVMIMPVGIGAIVATIGIFILAPIDPLNGTGIALFLAMIAVLIVIIFSSVRALPVKWPVRRIAYAFLLSLPLFISMKVVAVNMDRITIGESLIVLIIGGLYLVLAEYILARRWLGDIKYK